MYSCVRRTPEARFYAGIIRTDDSRAALDAVNLRWPARVPAGDLGRTPRA